MEVETLAIPEIKIITPKIYDDARGFFFESYHQERFEQAAGVRVQFVQDNHSKSSRGVARGLHYQTAPFAQAKLVRVIAGCIYDVAVDIRPNSPTYGQYVSAILSAENKKQIWIPEGFAHGFIALEDNSEICYKTNNFYTPTHDAVVMFEQKYIDNINIPYDELIFSDKDSKAELLDDKILTNQ